MSGNNVDDAVTVELSLTNGFATVTGIPSVGTDAANLIASVPGWVYDVIATACQDTAIRHQTSFREAVARAFWLGSQEGQRSAAAQQRLDRGIRDATKEIADTMDHYMGATDVRLSEFEKRLESYNRYVLGLSTQLSSLQEAVDHLPKKGRHK